MPCPARRTFLSSSDPSLAYPLIRGLFPVEQDPLRQRLGLFCPLCSKRLVQSPGLTKTGSVSKRVLMRTPSRSNGLFCFFTVLLLVTCVRPMVFLLLLPLSPAPTQTSHGFQ